MAGIAAMGPNEKVQTMDKADFASLEKSSASSFHQQKAMIKKLLLGKKVNCPQCGLPLTVFTPHGQQAPGVRCDKGCTNISLDFV